MRALVLGMDLGSPFQRGRGGPGGWIIIDEPELHLRPDVLVPDLAGWRRERMPEVPDVTGFELAPDGSAKCFRLRLHGWTECRRCLLLQSYGNDALVRAEPFAEVELELSAFWLSA